MSAPLSRLVLVQPDPGGRIFLDARKRTASGTGEATELLVSFEGYEVGYARERAEAIAAFLGVPLADFVEAGL